MVQTPYLRLSSSYMIREVQPLLPASHPELRVRYSTILYSTLLYSTLLYSTLLYSTPFYSCILYPLIPDHTKTYKMVSSALWISGSVPLRASATLPGLSARPLASLSPRPVMARRASKELRRGFCVYKNYVYMYICIYV